MLQPLITIGVITRIKIKTTVCVETPCIADLEGVVNFWSQNQRYSSVYFSLERL